MFGTIQDIIRSIGDIVDALLPLLVGVALVVFFWGLIKYINSAGDAGAAKEGKSIMIAGIIALFVMVSIWGIIELIGRELGIEQGGGIDVPEIETSGSGGSNVPFYGVGGSPY